MITSLISEQEWKPLFDGLPEWEPTNEPMVVVVPHPDDETLAAGGLIAELRSQGVEVIVVAVTDGENAYVENVGLAELRREEQACALERLGVSRDKTIRLGLTDSDVASRAADLVARLRTFVTASTLVLAPWSGDFHPDHEACARAAEVVAREADAMLISYFFWTWHRGTVSTVHELKLRKFMLTEDLRIAKLEALDCHASQLKHSPEPEILPDNLLWPARMPFEVFAL